MITQVLKKRIDKFIDESSLTLGDDSEKFEYFSSNMILKKYDYEESDLLQGNVDGSGDEGIDAIYVVVNGKVYSDIEQMLDIIDKDSKIKFIFIQCKQEKGFTETALLKLKSGIEAIFESEDDLTNKNFKRQSQLIASAWERHVEIGNIFDLEIEIYYATYAVNKDIALDNGRILQKKDKILSYLSGYGFKSSFYFLGCKELIDIANKSIEYRKPIEIITEFEYPEEEESLLRGHVCLVDGKEYLRFIMNEKDEIEDDIFEQNVRDYQGKNIEVNKNIMRTLSSQDINNFWCLNNGITLITTKKDKKGKKIYLSNYQIINGCQTSYSIFETFKNFSKEELNKVKFELILKIIEVQDENEDLTLQIVKATNSQSKIDSYALESYKPVHKIIEEVFLSKEPPYFYERRPKYYRRRGKLPNKILNPQRLFQVCYSVYFKEPSLARSNPTKLFKEKSSEVFKEGFDPDYYWIAYMLYINIVKKCVETSGKEYIDFEDREILNLGQLHLTRIIFYLILGEEKKLISKLNSVARKVLGNKSYELLNKSDIDIKKYYEEALSILREVIKENGNNSISNILKTSETDKLINSKMIDKLNQNQKQKVH